MMAGVYGVAQLLLRRPVHGTVCILLPEIVRRPVRRFVPSHSVMQLVAHGSIAHGSMRETVCTSMYSPMRQPVSDIVYTFVQGKVSHTEGSKDAWMHSVVHKHKHKLEGL